MNIRLIVNLMGKALTFLGLFMILPLLWALYDQGPVRLAFIISIIITISCGLLIMWLVPEKGEIRYRESFVIVTVGWFLVSLFGSLPFLLSGVCTSFSDAFFESVSGFTTTGATIFTDVEILPRGILFWRSLTLWLGGMGIIVFMVALLSQLGVGANRIFRAEIPGIATKILPRISETAQVLWITYLVLTLLETGLLWLLGMPLFDAICHSFGTVATGGVTIRNGSIGAYPIESIQWVIILFMFLSGVNFALYYQALRGRSLKTFWRNEEFRLYTAIVLVATVIIAGSTRHLLSGGEELIRTSLFQVVSIINTTGYTTTDLNAWPSMAQAVLITLMFIGGCSGSTSGSIKIGRILVLLKEGVVEIRKLIHPRAVISPKIEGKTISVELVNNIQQFFFLYVIIFVISGIIMTAMGLDLTSAFTSVAASLTNVGTGPGAAGSAVTYADLADQGKFFLSFLMLLGRLEIYTVFIIFSPSLWE